MRRLLFFVALAVLAAGCGSGSGKTVTVTTTVATTVTTPTHKTAVRVYFLRDGKVAPVARDIEVGAGVPRDALVREALFEGPTPAEKQAGYVTGFFSCGWTSSNCPKPGTTAGLSVRQSLAQYVYTVSQFAPSKPVSVPPDNKNYTRADFEEETPAILVESPLPFQAVTAPLRVTGTANTFEATFEFDLLDSDGNVLKHDFVTATSGSGTRGTFDFTIPFEAPNGLGKLVVYERSAADGSKTHVVEIPLTLAR